MVIVVVVVVVLVGAVVMRVVVVVVVVVLLLHIASSSEFVDFSSSRNPRNSAQGLDVPEPLMREVYIMRRRATKDLMTEA